MMMIIPVVLQSCEIDGGRSFSRWIAENEFKKIIMKTFTLIGKK